MKAQRLRDGICRLAASGCVLLCAALGTPGCGTQASDLSPYASLPAVSELPKLTSGSWSEYADQTFTGPGCSYDPQTTNWLIQGSATDLSWLLMKTKPMPERNYTRVEVGGDAWSSGAGDFPPISDCRFSAVADFRRGTWVWEPLDQHKGNYQHDLTQIDAFDADGCLWLVVAVWGADARQGMTTNISLAWED